MFRIKNWGNVGDFIYDKKEIKHLASLKHKTDRELHTSNYLLQEGHLIISSY